MQVRKTIAIAALLMIGPGLADFGVGRATAQDRPAQDRPKPGKKSHSVPGSPLDTLRSTHFTTTVPEMPGFVKESRPDPKTLDFAPMTGTDPERPKLRDQANIEALQAELEKAGAANAQKGRGLRVGAKREPR